MKTKIVLLFIFFSTYSLFLSCKTASAKENDIRITFKGGQLSVVDLTMVGSTNGSNETTIQTINLYDKKGNIVLSFNDCNSNKCSYSLEALPTGGYTAMVNLSDGSVSEHEIQFQN